ncbi:hypothetical protein SteCoe_30390 [Stentor coeruleus]|uniref:Uncharacterized protein n=1 Tax=Stentor coeruleus TaxID=5963 RepID=A0A1R2B3S2_9CILI|nr:hypothetical protein SteCoe_30390 [Stentor coeruleus]
MNSLICYTCKTNVAITSLICNVGCLWHCTCFSCYENSKILSKSEIDCEECKSFYYPKSSLKKKLSNFFGRGNCIYCDDAENPSPCCNDHSSCMKCARSSLLKLHNKEIYKCYNCIKCAFFYCKCCFGFVKNSDKYITSTCQYHFFCKICIIKKRDEIATFCSYCQPDDFSECAVCNDIFFISQCMQSHDKHYFCEKCYNKCLISTNYIEKVNCESCKDKITIEYTYHNRPATLQNSININNVNDSSYYNPHNQQSFIQNSIRPSENNTQRTSITMIPDCNISYVCDHKRSIAQAQYAFERDFEELIKNMFNKDFAVLNSGKYSFSCQECQVKYCYGLQMFFRTAQNVCAKYNLDDQFIRFYGSIFEGTNIKFTSCRYCQYCTGYFENNLCCYWCGNSLVN